MEGPTTLYEGPRRDRTRNRPRRRPALRRSLYTDSPHPRQRPGGGRHDPSETPYPRRDNLLTRRENHRGGQPWPARVRSGSSGQPPRRRVRCGTTASVRRMSTLSQRGYSCGITVKMGAFSDPSKTRENLEITTGKTYKTTKKGGKTMQLLGENRPQFCPSRIWRRKGPFRPPAIPRLSPYRTRRYRRSDRR